ncbi:MAG: outer membrane lipoprotein-sorting protein [Deltaproteobacteria bacterium]|nr:MAG: outer membrane lipoprotein-sorting protein [Deltaproteobacteria bacterium]
MKIRRDGALIQLDGHWRPGEVTVENLPEGTSTQLRLAWRAAPDVPASLFTPAGLRGPSTIEWPPD